MYTEGLGLDRDKVIELLSWPETVARAIEDYLNILVSDPQAVGSLYHRFIIDFALQPFEADRLLASQIVWLLTQYTRWRNSSGDENQEVFRQVRAMKQREENTPTDNESLPYFLKALAAFPDPADPSPIESIAPPIDFANRGSQQAEPTHIVTEARVKLLTPGARAIAAAYALQKAGKRVSILGACRMAKVDRNNLKNKFPEVVKAIIAMGKPDRTPRSGVRDRRTGEVLAVDEGED
jgi:hypothetical protein